MLVASGLLLIAEASADHTAAYFALAGALGAATVAIIGGQLLAWQQRKAERQRLRMQFGHERELRDLDAARETLAPMFARVMKSADAVASFTASVKALRTTDAPAIRDALTANAEAVRELSNDLGRDFLALAMLVGPGDPVAGHLLSVRTTMQRELEVVPTDAAASDEQVAEPDRVDDQHSKALSNFIRAAKNRVGWAAPG
jgi:hypothetical protein